MKDYKKSACVFCGEAFDEQSDIVICPECGAPHHRECWKELGHCACEEKHGEGYEWQPEKRYISRSESLPVEEAPSADQQEESVTCPNCGKKTKKSEKYCQFCGYYMYEQSDAFEKSHFSEKEAMDQQLNDLFPFDNAELIEGVPAGDVKRFVGNMWIYYIPRFIRMSRTRSPVSFNFTAFLTHGLWFISRGMSGTGILMLLAVAGTTALQQYLIRMAESLSQGQLAVLSMLSLILSGIEFVIMIISGLFGNRIYMNYCAKKIKKINAEATAKKADAEEFNRQLEASGGISLLPVFSVGFCFFVILYLVHKGNLF